MEAFLGVGCKERRKDPPLISRVPDFEAIRWMIQTWRAVNTGSLDANPHVNDVLEGSQFKFIPIWRVVKPMGVSYEGDPPEHLLVPLGFPLNSPSVASMVGHPNGCPFFRFGARLHAGFLK